MQHDNRTCYLISGVKKFDHISPTISALGWLPIKEHLLYRVHAINV